MKPKPIVYEYDPHTSNIILPIPEAPFDGKPVLIRLGSGWVEAWWDIGYAIEDQNGCDYRGWNWVCFDDRFAAELDDALEWCELPEGTSP